MVNRAVYYILGFAFILMLVLGGIILYQKNNQELKVIFLDIGQGDAILISQGSNQMLVDGGKSGKLLLEKLGGYIPFWDRDIEIMLATHPDQDHIGGLVSALKNYNVHKIIKTQAESESQTYQALKNEIEKESAEIIEARKGIKIKFPNGAEAEILYPFGSINSENKKDSNGNSIVAKLNFGENKFLFTGDLPNVQEKELLENNVDIKTDILKVAHHGSKYSTSVEFLKSAKPQDAVISVGKNNSYGHPAPEIIQKILKQGIKIWRTDEAGDVIYECKNQISKCLPAMVN